MSSYPVVISMAFASAGLLMLGCDDGTPETPTEYARAGAEAQAPSTAIQLPQAPTETQAVGTPANPGAGVAGTPPAVGGTVPGGTPPTQPVPSEQPPAADMTPEPVTPAAPSTPAAADPSPANMPKTDAPPQFPVLDEPAPFMTDMGGGWLSLIEGKWTLEPFSEGYFCVRFTLPEAVAFKSIVPLSPLGTHHTVLAYDDVATAPDGTERCTSFTNGDHILGASGVGTEPTLPLPEGVSYQLAAGSQLLLNLHVYNAGDSVLTGVSGSLVKISEAKNGDIQAEDILAGPVMLTIPPGRATQAGRCTFTGTSTIVQIMPHMHRTGAHMKVVAHSAAEGEVLLLDHPFDFEEQLFYPVGPVTLQAGDYVAVECTYENDTGRTLGWGDSSDTEMCFAGLVRYPPLGGNFGVACSF